MLVTIVKKLVYFTYLQDVNNLTYYIGVISQLLSIMEIPAESTIIPHFGEITKLARKWTL